MVEVESSCNQLHTDIHTKKNETKRAAFTTWWAQRWTYVEMSCLAVVMVVVWVALALPVIFFYMPVPDIFPPGQPVTVNSSENASSYSNTSVTCADAHTINVTELIEEDDSTIIPPQPITCSDTFYLVEIGNLTYCAPQCPTWHQSPSHTSILVDKVVLVCSCVGWLSAVGVLLIAFYRRHYIFTFPAVFIVYLTITLLILVSFFVINFFNREKLFCKSPNLAVSLLAPTPFCIISGVVLYYGLIQGTLWWLFHICTLFWAFRFPLHFRSFQKTQRTNYVHLVCILLALVVPVFTVVVTIGNHANQDKGNSTVANGLGFGMTNFPPILCAGLDAKVTFYSLIMPITIFTEIGMTLMIITFWNVRKHGKHVSKQKKGFKIGSGEKKIMIMLVYYAILVEFSLMAFTLATRNVKQFRAAITWHFLCESRGHDPANPCDRTQLEGLKYPGVSLVAYIMLVLFPTINFTYIINFRKLKRWFCTRVLKREINYAESQINSFDQLRKFPVLPLVASSVVKRTNIEAVFPGIDLTLTNEDVAASPG